MAKANFLFFINAYNDLAQTSTPYLNQFKWSREINRVPYNIENSQQIQVLPNSTSPNVIPYPFSTATASPSVTAVGTAVVTVIGSTAGISEGQLVVGSTVPVGTTVLSLEGSTLTLSNAVGSGTLSLSIYSPASFIYMESDQQVSVIYNNGSPVAINPFEINGIVVPGVFFINGPAYSLTITNPGSVLANISLASMG